MVSVFLSISVINNIKLFKSEFEGRYLLSFPADLVSGSDVILHTIDVNSLSDIRRLLLEGHQHVTGLIIKTWTLTGRDEEETVMTIKLNNSYCLVHVYAGDEDWNHRMFWDILAIFHPKSESILDHGDQNRYLEINRDVFWTLIKWFLWLNLTRV